MNRLTPATSQEMLRNIYNDAINVIPPSPDKSKVGQLTAEAMTKEYESAAKAIEAMGHELLAIQQRLDKEAAIILAAIEEVQALAKRYREEGSRITATVEDCAKQTQRVRDVCKELALP